MIQPYNDDTMKYSVEDKRYILLEEYVRNKGIDLGLVLETAGTPEPSKLPSIVLDRISSLVYENIYSYGRSKDQKEYLLACSPEFRSAIRDAMVERLRYMIDSGDLSTKSGVLLAQGVSLDLLDLVASPMELKILRNAGLLHRGNYFFIKEDIEY